MNKQFFILLTSSALLLAIFSTFIPSLNKRNENNSISSQIACETNNYSGLLDKSQRVAVFEGMQIPVSELAMMNDHFDTRVLGVAEEERWIEVDLSEQKLRAWEGDTLYLETPVSTGLSHTPTPIGEFRIWIKLRATKMEGGQGRNYYYLPNVPYVMFFYNENVPQWKGYGLHGTYWHNDFGNPRSHGCVNLPTPIAKEIYHWAAPVLSDRNSVVRSDTNNQGTRIIIHE